MKKIINSIWSDKVSFILLIVTTILVISWFVSGEDHTPFLAIYILYVMAAMIEKGKLADILDENVTDIKRRADLGLSVFGKIKPQKETTFVIVIRILILASGLGMLTMFAIDMLKK